MYFQNYFLFFLIHGFYFLEFTGGLQTCPYINNLTKYSYTWLQYIIQEHDIHLIAYKFGFECVRNAKIGDTPHRRSTNYRFIGNLDDKNLHVQF